MDARRWNDSSFVVYFFAGSFFALCVLLSGCVTPDPSVDLLEGELRWMEDQLYMMEDQLEQQCQELIACRESKNGQPCNCKESPTPAAPRSRSYDYDSYEDDAYSSGSSSRNNYDDGHSHENESINSDDVPSPNGERVQNQNREIPRLLESPAQAGSGSSAVDDDSLEFDADTLPPKVDLGTGTSAGGASGSSGGSSSFGGSLGDDDLEGLLDEPEIQLPEPEAAPRGVKPELESAGPDISNGGDGPSILSENVEQLQLNAARVSLYENGADQEKLLVVVEPQSRSSRYVEMSAPLEVVLEDVNHGGIYFNTWEFSALETGRTLRESKMGRGIHLALDWPKDVPLLDDLRVSVVYRGMDGTEVRADKLLQPKVQTTTVAGWVPASRSRNPDATEIAGSGNGDPESIRPTDPFALAETSTKVTVASQVFRTVPIAASAPQTGNATASWSQPIPSKREAADTAQKLTPISDVHLEPVRDVGEKESLRERIFGPPSRPAESHSQMDTRPLPISAAPGSVPKGTVSVESTRDVQRSSDPLPLESTSRSPVDASWTPYR